ncbi:MAG: AAA family ATPase [Deltaproteobacteria bacterium]|jgi:NadR type nicotinamide-nucleotide adenylyltransferase|nr:AAA family ATPase [Deltaproteobacteria bacterium]
MKTGLVIGKFAPFHFGHQYLFDTALSEVDKLCVLVYDYDLTDFPLQLRAGWIRALYPEATVIEGWGSPRSLGPGRKSELANEEFVLNLLIGHRITHFYSSRPHGEHMSRALGSVDRRVDVERKNFPITGEMIRRDPFHSREYLDPSVYLDLITKVVFLGAGATGKTTLAEALAREYKTVWVPESCKNYLETMPIGHRLGSRDFDSLILQHLDMEDEFAQSANRYLFVDSCAIMTYIYSLDSLGRASELVTSSARESAWRYDLFFLCDTEFMSENLGSRADSDEREVLQKRTVTDLSSRKIPFVVLKGTIEERIATVKTVLTGFQKHGNYFGQTVLKMTEVIGADQY